MNRNLILFAALGLGAFFLFKNKDMFTGKSIDEEIEPEGTKGDTVVETMEAQPGKVTQTLQAAKNLVEGAKNIIVNVKTPEGKQVRVARKSKLREDRLKKRKERQEAMKFRQQQRIAKRKARRKKVTSEAA